MKDSLSAAGALCQPERYYVGLEGSSVGLRGPSSSLRGPFLAEGPSASSRDPQPLWGGRRPARRGPRPAWGPSTSL